MKFWNHVNILIFNIQAKQTNKNKTKTNRQGWGKIKQNGIQIEKTTTT